MIFIDSNIFIFANIKEYPEYETAKEKIEKIVETDILAVNPIIISEVNYKLYRLLGSKESMKRTLKILSSEYVNYIPIEKNTVTGAVNLSYSKNIRINDAIIARHALDSNASLLTDNLKDFKKIPGLNLIPLKD